MWVRVTLAPLPALMSLLPSACSAEAVVPEWKWQQWLQTGRQAFPQLPAGECSLRTALAPASFAQQAGTRLLWEKATMNFPASPGLRWALLASCAVAVTSRWRWAALLSSSLRPGLIHSRRETSTGGKSREKGGAGTQLDMQPQEGKGLGHLSRYGPSSGLLARLSCF